MTIAYGDVSVEMTRSSMPLAGAMPHPKIELFILWVSKNVIFVIWLCQTFPTGPGASEPNNK